MDIVSGVNGRLEMKFEYVLREAVDIKRSAIVRRYVLISTYLIYL